MGRGHPPCRLSSRSGRRQPRHLGSGEARVHAGSPAALSAREGAEAATIPALRGPGVRSVLEVRFRRREAGSSSARSRTWMSPRPPPGRILRIGEAEILGRGAKPGSSTRHACGIPFTVSMTEDARGLGMRPSTVFTYWPGGFRGGGSRATPWTKPDGDAPARSPTQSRTQY
jgi:hypothetical protein